jgi:hypothetical protein
MAFAICVRIARTLVLAGALLSPLSAADNAGKAQLLAEFRKTKPEVSEVHVIAESPLLVAATGTEGWPHGELLGVFAHRGEQIVPISIVPNTDYPDLIRIKRQATDSITFALGNPVSDNLEIVFDPKTFFPRRMLRYSPVRIHKVTSVAGVVTLSGSDGKQDFTAREHNGAWQISTAPAAPLLPPKPVESELQIRPGAKQFPQVADEQIGPYQKVADKVWIGKRFPQSTGTVGVGDIGYFDIARQDWTFLHIPEMAGWSASALLVEPAAIWVGLVQLSDDDNRSGGLLHYDRATKKATVIPVPDVIENVARIGRRLYCGTAEGFAIVDQDQAHRFEFTPQADGSYLITPAI